MKLAIIIGSTREGRVTPKQAKWVEKNANQNQDIQAELIDLRDYPMPFFNEPISPRYNPDRKIDPGTKKWLDKISDFDAYIFVTPEYNHSIPAVLKNALDYVTWEIYRKPTVVVSHGANGGARANVALKEILSESRSAPINSPSSLSVAKASERFDENGNLSAEAKADPYGPQKGLDDLLKELTWYSDALKAARDKTSTE